MFGSPLIGAATEGHLDIVKMLIETGADQNLVCKEKRRAALDTTLTAGKVHVAAFCLKMEPCALSKEAWMPERSGPDFAKTAKRWQKPFTEIIHGWFHVQAEITEQGLLPTKEIFNIHQQHLHSYRIPLFGRHNAGQFITASPLVNCFGILIEMSVGNFLGGALDSLGNALGGTGSTLGLAGLTSPLGSALGNTGESLGNAVDRSLGSVNDILSSLTPGGPFQQCIRAAVGGDPALFAFPDILGAVNLPLMGDLTYDISDVHPYNLDHHYVPVAITYPTTREQVSAVVQCAATYGIAVQARSGGHSYENHCLGGADGSLVVDVNNLKNFAYNPTDGTVTFGSGNRLRDLTDHLASVGRTAAYGVVGDIGTGGHITIGGLGPLSRLLGTAADQIVWVECVLGDGQVVIASEYENPDFFFAIRGAGGSFAIVTQFQMSTIPANFVTRFSFQISFGRISDLADTFKAWQRFIANPSLPRDFSCTLTLTEGILIFQGFYNGDRAGFDQLGLQLILPFANPALSITSNVVTTIIHEALDTFQDIFGLLPTHFYAKSLKFTPQTLISDAAVDALFQYIEQANKGTGAWFIVFDLQGGRTSDFPQSSSAYWHRDALYFMQTYLVDLTAVQTVNAQIKTFANGLNRYVQSLVPGVDDSAYPGYVDGDLAAPQRAYWGGNVPVLQAIKAKWDPANVFRNPQSVRADVSQ